MTQTALEALDDIEVVAKDLGWKIEKDEAFKIVRAALSAVAGEPVVCPKEYVGKTGFYIYDFNPQRIHFRTDAGDMTALQVRGWGHLIGQGGGLGMSEKEAAKVQDDFGRWVAETLTAALERQSQ